MTDVIDLPVDSKSLLKQPNAEFLEKLRSASDQLDSLKKERESLNEKAAAIFADFERYGLNRHAVRAALKYQKLDPEQRENFDLSYEVFRKAVGLPVQGDLFAAAVEADIGAQMV